MRKIVCTLLVVVMMAILMMVGLCACGNENWGIGNYNFRHVHIGDGVEGYCAEVKSWHDNDLGIELHTVEFGNIYCSEGTYFLFESSANCPFCN